MKLPPLNPLMVFEVVGRHGSLTKAAGELNVTPGAASRQLKRLEESLGVELFVRSNRQLTFTRDGSHYWAAVNKLLHDLEHETTRLTRGRKAGLLTVRCPRMFMRSWLLPRLPAFYESHPEIDLRFVVGRSTEEIDASVDCGIRLGDGNWPDIGADFLISTSHVPLCTPAYLEGRPPISVPADLGSHTLLHSSAHPDSWARWLGPSASAVLGRARSIFFEGDGFAFQAALEGLGLTLGRLALVSREIESGRLVIPVAGDQRVEDSYYFVFFPGREQPRGFRAFRRWLRAEADKAVVVKGADTG